MSFFFPSHLHDLLFGVLMRVVYIPPHISFKCLQRPRKSPARGRRMKMKSSHVDLPQLPLLCATLVIRVYTERVSTKHCMIFLLLSSVANYVRGLVDICECDDDCSFFHLRGDLRVLSKLGYTFWTPCTTHGGLWCHPNLLMSEWNGTRKRQIWPIS